MRRPYIPPPQREVHRATRYRIYPTPEQEARMVEWQRALRFVWNLAHEQWLMARKRCRCDAVRVTYEQQSAELTELRALHPWLRAVPCEAERAVLRALRDAWLRCFAKLGREPRWKSRKGDALTLFAPKPRVDSESVSFPTLGVLRAVIHRPVQGEPISVRLVQDVDQWFAIVTCKVMIDVVDAGAKPAVGIDRGVVNLLADSTGRVVENPRHGEQMQARVAKAQRDVARKVEQAKADGRKPDGANIRKARERVAKLQRKVRRQREHVLQRESKFYASTAGVIVLEKLDVKAMSASARGTMVKPGRRVRQKAGLNRSIAGVAWSKFAGLMKYKADERGGRVVEVPAAYSSQTCSACGHVASANRKSQAVFECQACGHKEHADINAAKVIRVRGLAGETVEPKAPKKSLRGAKPRKDAAVPAVEACGGDPLVKGPDEAGKPRREAMAPVQQG